MRNGTPRLPHDATPAPRIGRLSSGFRYAEWLDPSRLGEAARDQVQDRLVDVSTRVFGVDMAPYWEGRRALGYFDDASWIALILDPDDRIIGWAGYRLCRLAGAPCVYLDSSGILREHQRRRLVPDLQVRALIRAAAARPLDSLYLVMRTANPVVYRALVAGMGGRHVHPAPGRAVPRTVSEIAAAAVSQLGPSVGWGEETQLDAATLRIERTYSNLSAVYDEPPLSGDGAIDGLFRQLGPADAFLIVARTGLRQLPTHLARRYARRARRVRALAHTAA